jgi:hypothetical protein
MEFVVAFGLDRAHANRFYLSRPVFLPLGRSTIRRPYRVLPSAYLGRMHRRSWGISYRDWVRPLKWHPSTEDELMHRCFFRLTVSTRISDDDFSYNLSTLKFMCEPHNLVLWLPALGLAVLLRLITHKYHHQLIFPLCESGLFCLF